VRDLFAEIESAAAPLARAKSIDLAFEISAGVTAVLADRAALERAILNLISNAVTFTPLGGLVRLRASNDRTNAVVSVSDTGMGMSAEDKDRLFTRFFRSPTAMSMAIPGTGLGLAIVKNIIDDHGGTIRVESEPGAGTTVEFTIPLATPAAGAGPVRVVPSTRTGAAAALA
jgi:signal transduction histidine kinase